jgi:DNA gyrase inhibitor GyrI
VPDEIEHDDEVDMQVLRGGSFAVYQTSFVRGGGLVAWERFAQGWLASSGYQIDFRPRYAAYVPKTRDDHGDDFSTEFCLAVKRPYGVTPQRRTCNFAKRGVTEYPDKRI